MWKIKTNKGKTFYWDYERCFKNIGIIIWLALLLLVSKMEYQELLLKGLIK